MRNTRILAAALLVASSTMILAGEPAQFPVTCLDRTGAHPIYKVSYPAVLRDSANCGEEASEAILPCCPYPVPFGAIATTNSSSEALIGTITRLVQPRCWKSAGGNCDITYSADTRSMVVNGPEEIQTQVASILESLRKNQNVQIRVEIRLLTVSDLIFTRGQLSRAFGIGSDDRSAAKQPSNLTSVVIPDWQVYMVMGACQNDDRFEVSQFPRITIENGRTTVCGVQDIEQINTGTTIETIDGQHRITQQSQKIGIGPWCKVCGAISPDRESILVRMRAANTFPTVAHGWGWPPMLPDDKEKIVRRVRNIFAEEPSKNPPSSDSALWSEADQPMYQTISMDVCQSLPCGSTLMMYAGSADCIVETKQSLPILGNIPVLNSLFAKKETTRAREHYIWLVTACLEPIADEKATPTNSSKGNFEVSPPSPPSHPDEMIPRTGRRSAIEEESVAPALFVAPWQTAIQPNLPPLAQTAKSAVEMRAAKKAEKLMQKYRDACAAGDPEKARKFARQALDLDPECITKSQLAPSMPSKFQNVTRQAASGSAVCESNDFWSKQTKEDITRQLIAPYMPAPQPPSGR
jgi:hypothetical protein